MNKNYWGYRIDNTVIDYFWKELQEGRLRIGWGWLKGQDLRKLKIDKGARRNLPIFNNVKKGDILLVPYLPDWDRVAIVEATEDFCEGYKYEIDDEMGDYGHIFPAKFLKSFVRSNENVDSGIRATLKARNRFWSVSYYAESIEKILNGKEEDLLLYNSTEDKVDNIIESSFVEVFKKNDFADIIYKKLCMRFQSAEWEDAIVYGLQKLFPCYEVSRVGGVTEVEHGTDILIKMPNLLNDFKYAIAIQVKDYEGYISTDVIAQINKADKYWPKEGYKIIDKWVIVTRAEKNDNNDLITNDKSVNIIFANELKYLFLLIGKSVLGIQ